MKNHVTRVTQLSAVSVQRIYKAWLVSGCLVITWSGCEWGMRAFNQVETRNLLRFLKKWESDIDKSHPDPILWDK